MYHFKLSAYNSNVQRIKDKKQKKILKSMYHFKLSAYNSNVQRIRKKKIKNLKKVLTF